MVQPKLRNGGVLVIICSSCTALHHKHARVAAQPRTWLALQDRSEAYKRTMCVGLTRWQSALLRAQLTADSLGFWVASCLLSCVELSQLPVL